MPCIASYKHDRLLRTKYWLHVLRSAYTLSSSHLCNDEQTIHTVWTAHGVNDCGLLWTYNYTENSDLMRYVQPFPSNVVPSLTSFPAWNCRAYALQFLRSLYRHLTDWHSSDFTFLDMILRSCPNGTYPDPQTTQPFSCDVNIFAAILLENYTQTRKSKSLKMIGSERGALTAILSIC
jgi:hypothetical protein